MNMTPADPTPDSFALMSLTGNENGGFGQALEQARAHLAQRTSHRIRNSVPTETRRAYAGDWARFQRWCQTLGYQSLPTDPDVLAQYVTHLADAGKAPSTIERAVAAILTAHTTANLPKPATKPARAALRHYRVESAENGRRVRKAPPVTITNLRAMVGTCDPDTLAGVRDRALIVVGFATGCRRSELAGLNIEDVEFCEEGVVVTVRKSKTDQDAHGRQPKLVAGRYWETCPIRTLRAWLDALAEQGVSSGPLFRRIDRHGNLGRAPHGRGDPQGRLTGHGIALIIRRAAQRAGLDHADMFTGHSLRRGFATETYRAGASMLWIAAQGGWSPGSKALHGYIDDVNSWQDNPLAQVGL